LPRLPEIRIGMGQNGMTRHARRRPRPGRDV
jgi:hypothetical protein